MGVAVGGDAGVRVGQGVAVGNRLNGVGGGVIVRVGTGVLVGKTVGVGVGSGATRWQLASM